MKKSREQMELMEAGKAMVLSRLRRVWDKGQMLCRDCLQFSTEENTLVIAHEPTCPSGRLLAAMVDVDIAQLAEPRPADAPRAPRASRKGKSA